MKLLLILIFFFTPVLEAQYFPRGTNINDGYLPNLDQPDKWIISLDGMFDWQRERVQGTETTDQTTHGHFNLFYGGQNFRGGLQVIHDFNRQVKDLSLGVGFAFNRPLFVEVGAGYLNRVAGTRSSEGWSYNAQVGYYYNWIMYVKYRVRIRLSILYNYKKINEVGDPDVSHLYPMIGFEFET